MGQMILRKRMAVLRMHRSNKKEGYEQYYAEMMLFSHWRNEEQELHPNDQAKCLEEYKNREQEINLVKNWIFPGENALDLEDFEYLEENRPQHVYDMLDCQGEQENDDDNDLQDEDNLEIAPLAWNGKDEPNTLNPDAKRESGKFRLVPMLKDDELMILTRMQVGEQKEALSKVINICKSIKRRARQHSIQIEQLLLLIHGGAGI